MKLGSRIFIHSYAIEKHRRNLLKITLQFTLILAFFLILLFPEYTISGTIEGLLLWYRTLLPTLFPFLLLTNLIIRSNVIHTINQITYPFIGRFFSISKNSAFVVIVGFICGYPMGAKMIKELLNCQQITKEEAQYLLSFCNNTSPMFLIGFVATQVFKDSIPVWVLLISVYGSAILFSFFYRKSTDFNSLKNCVFPSSSFSFSLKLMDESIIDSMEILVKIGGYIVTFSILIQFLNHSIIIVLPSTAYILPIVELTSGIHLCVNSLPIDFAFLYTIFLSTFGGMCSLAQTNAVLLGTGLSMTLYLKQKIITAILAAIIAYLILSYS